MLASHSRIRFSQSVSHATNRKERGKGDELQLSSGNTFKEEEEAEEQEEEEERNVNRSNPIPRKKMPDFLESIRHRKLGLLKKINK